MIRATAQQKADYRYSDTMPATYPLVGYVKIDGHTCAVEKLTPSDPDDPRFEIMAPDGYHFLPDLLHSFLCRSLTEVDLFTSTIEKCNCD